MASHHLKTEKLFKGRAHRKGEQASDPRESGATRKARVTIRQHRERAAAEADRRNQ